MTEDEKRALMGETVDEPPSFTKTRTCLRVKRAGATQSGFRSTASSGSTDSRIRTLILWAEIELQPPATTGVLASPIASSGKMAARGVMA